MNKLKLIFSLFLVLVISGLLSVYFYQRAIVQGLIRKADYSRSAILISKKIEKIWREGDRKGLISRSIISCPKVGDLSNVGDSYLMCNPKFVSCYLKEKENEFFGRVLGKKSQIKFKTFSKSKDIYQIENRKTLSHPLTLDKQIRLSFSFSGDNEEYSLLLDDSCSDIYLPQRIYGYSRPTDRNRSMNWRWDNFGRFIYVDKFLVSNLMVNDWIDRFNLEIMKNNDLSRSATHLKYSEMQSFCEAQGKQLLTAQVYDALTIHPGRIENKSPKRSLKYIYPWSRLRIKSFLFKKKKNEEYQLTKKDCLKAYTLDCRKVTPYRFYDTRSVSWSGIYQILGGPFEAMRNTVDKKYNVKSSSFYSLASSDKHELGSRLEWDKENHSFKNIIGVDPYINENDKEVFRIGFRCMRNIADD